MAEQAVTISLADGTELAGSLLRPDGLAQGPALVSYYPYRADDIIGSVFEGTRLVLARRGYATLLVDMAGTGASHGAGESFDLPREGRDLAEVIEWAAAQHWCDGRVGAWGVSYGGMTALAAAAQRPPHLRAIVAVYAGTDVYADTIAPGGCLSMLGRYAWAAHMVALGLCPPTRQDPAGRWRAVWESRLRRLAAGSPHAVTWQAHPGPDEYWHSRVVDATAIEVPALLIAGWADAYSDAIIRTFGEVRGPRRLVVGPWMHVLPHLSDAGPWDWAEAMADWWDTHLRPAAAEGPGQPPDPAPGPPVVFFAGRAGGDEAGGDEARGEKAGAGWRSALAWPPPGGTRLQFYLAGSRLLARPPDRPGQVVYHGDPGVGIAAGIWDPFGTGHGWPEEQSSDDARSLTFTSEPLADAVLVAGRPEASLHAGHDPAAGPAVREAFLAARLTAVAPGGRSTLITAGWARLPAGAAPGTLAPLTITLGAAACTVPAGYRLRLSLACANFPHLWPAPVNPVLLAGWGPGQESVLRVPVGGDSQPAVVTLPPPGRDTGWATGGEPVYRVVRDKAAGEVEVTFGIRSELAPPSGARLRLAETFTARLRESRPDGAALLARADISIRMPAGERVDVAVRAAARRQSSVTEARVTLDGTQLLQACWTGGAPGADPAAGADTAAGAGPDPAGQQLDPPGPDPAVPNQRRN